MHEFSSNEDLIECPNCAELIQTKAIICRFCQVGVSALHFYPCPSCNEMVRRNAILCRFCQSRLFIESTDLGSSPTAGTRLSEDDLWNEKSSLFKPLYTLPLAQRRARLRDLSKFQKSSPYQNWGSYGAGVRAQVFEVIVRQAIAGAPWREICAGPMSVNGITPEEIEQELKERGYPDL